MRRNTLFLTLCIISVSACVSPPPQRRQLTPIRTMTTPSNPNMLKDRAQFLQADKKWAAQTLGGSNESLKTDGCLVTAAAMALVNLGFRTDPGDLTNRLKAYDGFTKNGWLVWSGLERASANRIKAVVYEHANDAVVRSCLAAGYYPLVKFNLPSRRTHWVMVVGETPHGFFIRDPMVNSRLPIPLSARSKRIDAVRCIGLRA